MAKVKALRGLIYSMYDSEAQFASKIGWPRQRISKITNGYMEPDVRDLNDLARGLNKTVEEVAQIFLRR